MENEKVTIDLKALVTLLSAANPAEEVSATHEEQGSKDKLIGRYVLVRCRDAGVHAGFLESRSGRECVLTQSRRLWYWKCKKSAFLSGVAVYGLHSDSKVGAELERICLTENCEIMLCTPPAQKSIAEFTPHLVDQGNGHGSCTGHGQNMSSYGSGRGGGGSGGDGSGRGYGSGDGDGSGFDDGYDDGSGSGSGDGDGKGYDDGDGSGYGRGYGDGKGYGYGHGDGSGYGRGRGDGDGNGVG